MMMIYQTIDVNETLGQITLNPRYGYRTIVVSKYLANLVTGNSLLTSNTTLALMIGRRLSYIWHVQAQVVLSQVQGHRKIVQDIY